MESGGLGMGSPLLEPTADLPCHGNCWSDSDRAQGCAGCPDDAGGVFAEAEALGCPFDGHTVLSGHLVNPQALIRKRADRNAEVAGADDITYNRNRLDGVQSGGAIVALTDVLRNQDGADGDTYNRYELGRLGSDELGPFLQAYFFSFMKGLLPPVFAATRRASLPPVLSACLASAVATRSPSEVSEAAALATEGAL